jgi:hypothetical protein
MYEINQDVMTLLVWFINSAKLANCGLEEATKLAALKQGLELAIAIKNNKQQAQPQVPEVKEDAS